MGHKKKCCKKVTRYVQGGLEKPGKGCKKCPWNSLELAQADDSWDRLVVLYSDTPLNGGISLRPKTCLIGKPKGGKKPIITNNKESYVFGEFPDAADNFGNGAYVLAGDVKIVDIHFDNTWASGVNYDNADNIVVAHCLVTGFSQGGLVVPPNSEDLSNRDYEIGGLNGNNTNDGKSIFFDVEISDNFSGYGIFEVVSEATQRKICVRECKIHNLVTNVSRSGTNNEPTGIRVLSLGEGTRTKLCVKSSEVFDFVGFYWPAWDETVAYKENELVIYQGRLYRAVQNSTGQIPENNPAFWDDLGNSNPQRPTRNFGIFAAVRQGAYLKHYSKKTIFRNIASRNPECLRLTAETDGKPVDVRSELVSIVKKCEFLYEQTISPFFPRLANCTTNAADACYKFCENTAVNMSNAFLFNTGGNAIDNYDISKNQISTNTLISLLTAGHLSNNPTEWTPSPTIVLERNNVDLSSGPGPAQVRAIIISRFQNFLINTPEYELASLSLQGNCFNDLEFAFSTSLIGTADSLGTVVINAAQNNFIQTSENDFAAENSDVTANIANNYWDPSPPTFTPASFVNANITFEPVLDEPIVCYEPCH